MTSRPGTAVFEASSIQAIHGGSFYGIHGTATIQHIQNSTHFHAQGPSPSTVGAQDPIDAVVTSLEKLYVLGADFRKIHQDVVDKSARDTGESFRANVKVSEWMDRGKLKCLWIRGGPGSGKTYMAAAFIRWSEAKAEESPPVQEAVIFAYLRYTEKLTAWDIVLSLIIQLVQCSYDVPSVAAHVQKELERHRRKRSRPSYEDLVTMLKVLVKHFRAVRIYIDGIDEMLTEIQWPIVETIVSLDAWVIFTSRPMKLIEDKLRTLLQNQVAFINFSAQKDDLELFLNGVIDRTPSLARLLETHKVRREIIMAIIEKAAGMFLHASLQVELLQHCRTLHSVYETIKQFPKKIEDLYANTLDRIPKTDIDLARLILVWVLNAKITLTITELQQAIAVSPETYRYDPKRVVSEEDILSICRGLITIASVSRYVRLVHLTAYDILAQLLAASIPRPQEILAWTCLSRLVECGFQDSALATDADLQAAYHRNHLLLYAHSGAQYHIHKARTQGCSPEFAATVESFIVGCKAFPTSRGPGREPHHLHILSAFHVAILFGLDDLAAVLVQAKGEEGRQSRVNQRAVHPSGMACTSLMLASAAGNIDLVLQLLAVEDIDVCLADNRGNCALGLAALGGHTAVVQVLCDRPDTDVNQTNKELDSPLTLAAWRNHATVVEILLQTSSVQVNHRNHLGRTGFFLAAAHASPHVVRAFLEISPNLDPHLADLQGFTPLYYAAGRGNLEIVNTLIKLPGTDVNHTNHISSTPLTFAISYAARVEVINALLAVPNIDVNRRGWHGLTALIYAASNGRVDVVRALLAHPGIEVNLWSRNGCSAVMEAACRGQTDVLQVLLEDPRVDLTLKTASGLSILTLVLLAAPKLKPNFPPRPTPPAFFLLLKHPKGRAIAHAEDAVGWTPLMRASQCGYLDVVERLLEIPGADLDARTKDGKTALGLALEAGHDVVVEKLRTAGATEDQDELSMKEE